MQQSNRTLHRFTTAPQNRTEWNKAHARLYLKQTDIKSYSYSTSLSRKCYDAKKFTDERSNHEARSSAYTGI